MMSGEQIYFLSDIDLHIFIVSLVVVVSYFSLRQWIMLKGTVDNLVQ